MSELFSQSAWSLADLFPSRESAEVQAAFDELEQRTQDFEKLRPQLTSSITEGDFLQTLRLYEGLNHLAYRLNGFAGLSFAADTQLQAAQAFMVRVDQLLAELQNRTLFFSLWWKDLDDVNAGRLLENSGDFRYWLEEMRHYKPHTLSEAEEKVVNIKDITGANALTQLYDTITNRYTFKISVDGKDEELTRGELMVYARHYDADLRARAYQELYGVFGQDGPVLGQVYQALVRDWGNEKVGLRHYPAPIAARNLANDIPDEVVDTLLAVCERNAPVFQRFFALKARLLGGERLRRYDIYAPVVRSEKRYSFQDAAEMVLDSFSRFDPQVAALALQVFEENHLDSQVRKGKRGGAFCWSVAPGMTPWVLVNYQGRSDDVSTLAHELGHSVHASLAADHSLFTYHSSLPLAETASTFGEMLLLDRLLQTEQDEAVRRDLLFRQVDDSYATIGRQAFFALFERQAHSMVAENATVDELSAAYLENLKRQFGEAVEVSDEFRWEWVSIPHFYRVPFYVYAYAFGQLLVLSLYQQYRQERDAFKPRYLQILSTGGSASPAQILSGAGIDIYADSFWQGGFDVLSNLVDQLESLPAHLGATRPAQ
jgi:oligoendopeptidase F